MGAVAISQKTLASVIKKLCTAVACLQEEINGGGPSPVTPTNGLSAYPAPDEGIGLGGALTQPITLITGTSAQQLEISLDDPTLGNTGISWGTQAGAFGLSFLAPAGAVNLHVPNGAAGSRQLLGLNSTYLQVGYMGGGTIEDVFPYGTMGFDQTKGALAIGGGGNPEAYVISTGSGTSNAGIHLVGAGNVQTIPHGLGNTGVPRIVNVHAYDLDALDQVFYFTWDATNITVAFKAAPTVGAHLSWNAII